MAEADNAIADTIMNLDMSNDVAWVLDPQETIQAKFDRVVMYNVIRNSLPEGKLRWLADEQGTNVIAVGDVRGLYKKVHVYVNRTTAGALNRLHSKFCHSLTMKGANCDLDSWQVIVSNKAQELADKGRAVDEAQKVQVYLDGLIESYARIREELLTKPSSELTWEYMYATTRVEDFSSSMDLNKRIHQNKTKPTAEDQFNVMYRMWQNKNNTVTNNRSNRTNNDTRKADKVCRCFSKGQSKHGDDCHFKHVKPSQEETKSPEQKSDSDKKPKRSGCWNCHEKGHHSDNCPKPKSSQNMFVIKLKSRVLTSTANLTSTNTDDAPVISDGGSVILSTRYFVSYS